MSNSTAVNNPVALPDGQYACPCCGEVYSERSAATWCSACIMSRPTPPFMPSARTGLTAAEQRQAVAALLITVAVLLALAAVAIGRFIH